MEVQDSISEESSYSNNEETERPNRWTRPPSTWQALTAQERGLEASLLELRNRDLSLHLYNSFALKRDAHRYLEAKKVKPNLSTSVDNLGRHQDLTLEDDHAGDETEELTGKGWAPQKVWTAWPLPPDLVPRSDERVGPEDGDEIFTSKRREKERPSRELEDVLVGTALRFAKERWEGRDVADDEEEVEEGASNEERADSGKESGTEEMHGQLREDGELNDVIEDGSRSEDPPKPAQEKTILRPILSADDDHSRDLLRPSIRHNLSQLDAVLMALHHARKICHRYATDPEVSTDEDKTRSGMMRDDSVPAKRRRGRPRKFENLTSRPKPADGHVSEPSDVELWRVKKTHRGRPQKQYDHLEGETQQEYLVRIARMQKKPLPTFASSPVPGSPAPPSVRRRRTSRRGDRLNTRDWSEVVGSAALVGFPPEVIARTSQRCADLFGEGMTIRNLIEAPSRVTEDHFLTTYKPEEIPDLNHEVEASSEDSYEEDLGWKQETRKSKKSLPGRYDWLCPIEKCPRRGQGFSHASGLMRHLKKVHSLTDGEADELLNSDEETYGAVHVDGFLKPLRNTKRDRGRDKGKRSSGRWHEENTHVDETVLTAETEVEDRFSVSSESH
jgi:hypothetical protein